MRTASVKVATFGESSFWFPDRGRDPQTGAAKPSVFHCHPVPHRTAPAVGYHRKRPAKRRSERIAADLRFSFGRPHPAWQVDRERDDARFRCLVRFN